MPDLTGGVTKQQKVSEMKEFFEDCLKLPYKGNSQDNPEHENQVEELLKKHGLVYESQPNGTQNSPDFYVYYGESKYSIECKSSKGAKPVYNSGLPKPDVIYVFSSAKYNATTIYNSDDILNREKRVFFGQMIEEIWQIVEKYRKIEGWQDKRGWDFYMRSMFIQRGKSDLTDYFTHKDRGYCEKRVLEREY